MEQIKIPFLRNKLPEDFHPVHILFPFFFHFYFIIFSFFWGIHSGDNSAIVVDLNIRRFFPLCHGGGASSPGRSGRDSGSARKNIFLDDSLSTRPSMQGRGGRESILCFSLSPGFCLFFCLYSSLALSVSLIYPTTFLSLVFFPKLISCSQHDHTSPVFPCDYSPLGILQVILLIYCSWRHTFCRLEIYPQRDIKGLGRLNVIFYLLVFSPLISAFLSRTYFFHNYCFLVLL